MVGNVFEYNECFVFEFGIDQKPKPLKGLASDRMFFKSDATVSGVPEHVREILGFKEICAVRIIRFRNGCKLFVERAGGSWESILPRVRRALMPVVYNDRIFGRKADMFRLSAPRESVSM